MADVPPLWLVVRRATVPVVLSIDPFYLGMAMDLTDEEDAVLGVVGRGTKAERVAARYAALAKPDWVGKPDANGDIHCSRLAPKRCLYVEGHYGGCATP